jgi:hypothetical protein
MALWQGIPYTIGSTLDPFTATYAVINDSTDPNFVGYLSEPPSGLGAAGVREVASQAVDGDGGRHGNFLYDRMPIGLSGIIMPSGVQATDEARQNRLLVATTAMRADGQILWTEAVRGALTVPFRTQQKTRITSRRPKAFTVALVNADWRVFKQAVTQQLLSALGASVNFTITNTGNADADWEMDLWTQSGVTNLSRVTVTLYTDASRTIPYAIMDLYNGGTALVPAGADKHIYIRAGNPAGLGSGGPGQFVAVSGAGVDLTPYLTFDPLNWVRALPGTSYGRVTCTLAGGSVLPTFTQRDAWDY